jgi:hypothetical protein
MRLIVLALALLIACDSVDAMPAGLPWEREETATAASGVKAETMNAIVARHNRSIHFGPASFLPERHDNNWTVDGQYLARDVVVTAGALGVVLDLTPWVIPGDTIKEIIWRWTNGLTPTAGAVSLEVSNVNVLTGLAGALAVNDVDDTNTGGAAIARNVTVAVAHEVLADHLYRVRFNMDDTANDDTVTFRGITVVLENP